MHTVAVTRAEALRMHELLVHSRGEQPLSCRICREQIAEDQGTEAVGAADPAEPESDTVVLQVPSIIRERGTQ